MPSKAFALFLTGASAATFAGVLFWPTSPGAEPVRAAGPASESPAEPDVFYPGCRAVAAAGKAPLLRGQPGYRSDMDGDDDGIACEDY